MNLKADSARLEIHGTTGVLHIGENVVYAVFRPHSRQYADEDSEESREEVAHYGSSEPDKLFFKLEEAETVMSAFENLNYRERAMV